MKNGLPIAMDDKEYLPLSWLSQSCYCQRRAGLLLNERLWSESIDTAKGRAEHEKVHTQRVERRGDFIKLYEYTVYSDSLALRGRQLCAAAGVAHVRGRELKSGHQQQDRRAEGVAPRAGA